MENYIIYRWTNKRNGKVYIGQTGNLQRRKTQYLNGYAGNSHLKGAFKKYTFDEFVLESIDESATNCDELNTLEQKYIDQYDSMNPSKGYNKKPGGNITEVGLQKIRDFHRDKPKSEEHKRKISEAHMGIEPWNKGKTCSDEMKDNISKSLKGRVRSDEHKKHLSESLKGRIPWNKGKKGVPISEEAKKKISDSLKGRIRSEEHSKKISDALKKRNKKGEE